MILQDKDLKFDEGTLRYYLTEDYVYNEVGDLKIMAIDEFDTNQSTLGERTIKRACNMLYDFIEAEAVDSISSLYLITHSKRVLNGLKRALALQLEYFIEIGDTANAIGFKTGDRISRGAIEILKSLGVFNIRINRIPKDIKEW